MSFETAASEYLEALRDYNRRLGAYMRAGSPILSKEALRELTQAAIRERKAIGDYQEEIDKRRMSALTISEDENLLNWGYPYVFNDFRFHITLTEKIQCQSDRESMVSAASAHFSESLENTIKVSSISLFVQESSEADFLQIKQFALQE